MFLWIALPDDGLHTRPKHVAVITHNKDIVTLNGRKYEIFLELQQHNGLIFTKIVLNYSTSLFCGLFGVSFLVLYLATLELERIQKEAVAA
jgi:hypothetical protein